MNKTNTTIGSKSLHKGTKCNVAYCSNCGRVLPSVKDRIGHKDEKVICPDCYRDIVVPYGSKKQNFHRY